MVDFKNVFSLLRTEKVFYAVVLVTGIVRYKQNSACTSLNIVLATGEELNMYFTLCVGHGYLLDGNTVWFTGLDEV